MQMTWLDILRHEAARTSVADVARRIGYARPSVSLVLNGRYPGGTAKIAARVVAVFCDRILCPHLERDLAQEDCAAFRSRPVPQSDPAEFRHWNACQVCSFNPDRRPTHA